MSAKSPADIANKLAAGRAYYYANREKIMAAYYANRPLHLSRMKVYRDKNKAKLRASRFIKHYGLSPEDYSKLLDSQNGRCLICGEKGHRHGRHDIEETLYVDHDHATGAVRGLLCGRCNKGLGLFRDNVRLLGQAAEYIMNHKLSLALK